MKLVVVVGWIVTLVAAFGLGRSIIPRETPDAATLSLSDALDSKDYLVRMYGVAKVLEGLGPDNIDANLATFEHQIKSLDDSEIRAFMMAWARFDPEAAFAWATGRTSATRNNFVKSAVWAWASVDPQRAAEAVNSMPAGKREEQEFLLELIKGWIRSGDFDGATAYVLSVGGGRQNSMLVNKMANWIAADGIDDVIAWAESIPEGGDDNWAKKAAFRAAIGAVAREDTSRATAWYQAHQEFEYAGTALKTLSFAWLTRADPLALFEWLQTLPAGQLRVETIRQAYRRWLKQDPQSAIDWMRSVELTPALDPALAVYARYESRVSAETAVEWANRIDEQALQRLTLVPILRLWAKEDPEAARDWMVAENYPESVRNDIVGRLSREAAELRQELETATDATTAVP